MSQTCPGPSDGPSIVANAVTVGHRALAMDPLAVLPPSCVLTAAAGIARRLPDTVLAGAVALTDESLRRSGDRADLLSARIGLQFARGNFAEVIRSYERLSAADPGSVTLELSNLVIGSAHRTADTATLIRVMTRAAENPAAGQTIAYELAVLRQVGRLRAAVSEGRLSVRQYPATLSAYPSLITNFGTLGLTDSVLAYTRLALARGVSGPALSSSMELVTAAMLRRATLYGDVDGTEVSLAAALRIDSLVPVPATRFLVAALVARTAAAQAAEMALRIRGTAVLSGQAEDRGRAARDRAAACARIPSLVSLLDLADDRLAAGGGGYTGSNVAPVRNTLSGVRAAIPGLREACVP